MSSTRSLQNHKYLFHNQSVEWCVKEVSAATAAKVIGRDGFIRTRLKCRKLMPQRETKNDDFKGQSYCIIF